MLRGKTPLEILAWIIVFLIMVVVVFKLIEKL